MHAHGMNAYTRKYSYLFAFIRGYTVLVLDAAGQRDGEVLGQPEDVAEDAVDPAGQLLDARTRPLLVRVLARVMRDGEAVATQGALLHGRQVGVVGLRRDLPVQRLPVFAGDLRVGRGIVRVGKDDVALWAEGQL